MTDPRIDDTDRLLREREARSLMIFLAVALASFVAESANFTIQVFLTPHEAVNVTIVGAYLAFSVVATALCMFLVHKRRWMPGIGIIVAVSSASFAAVAKRVATNGASYVSRIWLQITDVAV